MIDVTKEFRDMMKDIMFGKDGYFKDFTEDQKAKGLELIENTRLVNTDSDENQLFSDKKYQVFELSQDGRYLLSCIGHKDYLIFFGTEREGMQIWQKLIFSIDLLKECKLMRTINLVNAIHYFDSQEDMQEYLHCEYEDTQ